MPVRKPGTITPKEIMAIVEKQGYRCPLSGRPLTPETASLDHVVPLAKGGEHSIENIWVVDFRVNIAKGTMLVDEFVAMCADVASANEQGNPRFSATG